MSQEIGFLFVVESGHLEAQAILLVESIRQFAGPLASAPLWAVRPRAGPKLRDDTCKALDRLGVTLLEGDRNKTWSHYGFANKIYASAWVEELAEGKVGTLCFLDTDVVVCQPPTELILAQSKAVAMQTVGVVNVGLRAEEPINSYWRAIYDICGTTEDQLWNTETATDGTSMLGYFNSGMVAVRPSRRLFRHWEIAIEQFAKSKILADILPQRRSYTKFLDQTSLAGVVMAHTQRDEVLIAPVRYNYMVHMQDTYRPPRKLTNVADIVILHYSQAFCDWKWTQTIEVPPPYMDWLRPRLPMPTPAKSYWIKRHPLRAINSLLQRFVPRRTGGVR